MRVFHRILAITTVLLGLIVLTPRDLLAIGEEFPIVALSDNNIYFVSPEDGETRLIVERDAEKDALLKEIYAGAELQLGPMSPYNTHFAYTEPLYEMLDSAYEDKRVEIANLRPRELFLVDMATGEITAITHQGENFADAVKNDALINISNLTWSIDNQRLYFLASKRSLRNRVPQNTIEYYDMASGEVRVLASLNSQIEVVGLYPLFTDLLLLDGAQNQGSYTFTQYDSEGTVVNTVDMELTGSMDCTNGLMFDMNPVFDANIIDYYYGYYVFKEDTGEMLPSMLNVRSNNSTSLDESFFPAIISQINPLQSLRLVLTKPCDYSEDEKWALADISGEVIEGARFTDVYYSYELSISPDGQSVAMLNGDTIRIIDVNSETTSTEEIGGKSITFLEDNATRELDFSATQLMWGAMNFTFAQARYHG